MLRELSIRDMLLIEALDLTFQPGLNVLTGETGAGKSILLDSLGFVLGWRGRAELVRHGAAQGEVAAVFDLAPDHPANAVLDEAGIAPDDQLILRRINSADGRKRGFVNDRRVSGDVLRALSATLVELHGQQDDRGLLDPREHRALLDAFGELDARRTAVRAAWRALSAARAEREAAEAALAEAARDAEFLRHAVAELTDLAPEPGEDAALDTARRQMQTASRIRDDVARAVEIMGADGAESRLAEAIRWLESVADRAGGALEEPIAALGRALTELGEAQAATESFQERLEFDPYELERTEERLFAIRGLARKHDVQPDDLPALAEDLSARLAAIDGGEEHIGQLRKAEAAAQAAYDAAAGALSAARAGAATRLDAQMAAELAPLKMERAVFETRVTPAEPGPEGRDAVTFTVATNPGAPAGPLGKIASGGELSRFLLALKVCLSRRVDGLTMIFDEIDRGVGGATADAVGRRLARVADGAQVLVVTHSPQVAALGGHHFQVSKAVTGETTRTDVRPLDSAARVDEIARMLSGDRISEEARSAARALLGGIAA
ncbi:DNA repair protein RecN [Rhodobacteraceae bacterium 2CG4]|uniref:DNA repair protein RecN n=1 Tax=Halovulum marinum TaxID=2662447 RepID=A0A6L5Z2Q5_9RHOB|nr:DNA repair protein RecN [Halovulum marinum]MSU90559.1 DNA repair protein RecN [Halovulum marinum]